MSLAKNPSKITKNVVVDDNDDGAIKLITSFDDFLVSGAMLLENIQNGMCIVDIRMVVRVMNKKLRSLTGRANPSPTNAATFHEVLPKSHRVSIAVEKCLATGKAITLQRNITIGKTVKNEPYLVQLQPLKDKRSADVHGVLVCFYEDLGEHKKHYAEEKLALTDRIKVLSKDVLEKQSLIRTLLDKSPFGIALLDTDRHVIQINRRAAEILDINKRQAVGLGCERLFQCYTPENGCPVLVNKKILDRKETQCAHGDCADKTMLRSVLLSKDQEKEIILEAFVDISEIKHAEAAKEMAYQAKNDFFAKMSHELRTPLNAIIGYSDLMVEDFDSIQRDEMLEFIGAIQRSGYDLLHLVDQVLDIAKIEDGHMRQEFFTKSLKLVLQELDTAIKPMAEKGNNQLTLQCQEGIDLLYTEHEHLWRILLNLLSNACKFTKSGRISLSVNREMLEETPWIHFEVSDTGVGLSPEQAQRVFEKFEQADNSTTRKHEGSGLGLTIANELCTMMGGHITVTSEPQVGSTFTVWIPEIKDPTNLP